MDKDMNHKLSMQVEEESIWSKQRCEVHPSQLILYISIDPTLEFAFKCIDCVSDRQVDQKSLIPIHQILSADKTKIFSNFPTSDFDLTTKFKETMQLALTYEEYLENIEATFKMIQAQVLDTLEKSKEKMKQTALEMSTNDVFNQTYVQLSQILKLRGILFNQESSITQKSTELNTLFTAVQLKENDNKYEMNKLFHKYKCHQDILNPENKLLTKEILWNSNSSEKILNFYQIPRIINQLPCYFENFNDYKGRYSPTNITLNKEETIIKELSNQYYPSVIMTSRLPDENGYKIKLNFSHPYGISQIKGEIQIGFFQGNSFTSVGFFSKLNKERTEVVKGSYLSSDPLCDVTYQLEIRWCIQKKQFYIADSKYENINKAVPSNINPSQKSKFAIRFSGIEVSNFQVSISDFFQINPDDVPYFE